MEINKLNILLSNAFYSNINPVVIINKIDLLSSDELLSLKNKLDFINKLDIPLFFISTFVDDFRDKIEPHIKNAVIATGGPSGVGKSSLLNMLQSKIVLEIGEVSKKIGRGKHTTKGASLISLGNGSYLIDTPGFGNIEMPYVKNFDEFITLFPEIAYSEESCFFKDCIHINEPKCGIKELVQNKHISKIRYDFYKEQHLIFKERWNRYD